MAHTFHQLFYRKARMNSTPSQRPLKGAKQKSENGLRHLDPGVNAWASEKARTRRYSQLSIERHVCNSESRTRTK